MSASMVAALRDGRDRRPPVTVLYDERCELCRQLEGWLSAQPTLVPVVFVAAASAEARRRFPALDHERTVTVLTVIDDAGAVYEGERAWLICAWALPRWRPMAERAGHRAGLPFVRVGARAMDRYRHRRLRRSYGGACADGADCRITAPPRWPAPDPRHRRG
jgi:predicted DCC family thiol-disulfide oxidoreductase YuxK